MEHDIHHGLSQVEARGVVHRALAAYALRFASHAPELTWTGDDRVDVAFIVRGMRLTGSLDIGPDKFRLRLEVPWLLRPFRARAIERVGAEVAGWLAQAKLGGS
jgi:hypothetical protein